MIGWLLSCATSPPPQAWTADAALAPTLARLDTDGDGRVVADEWARIDDRGATFAEADADHDGAVSVDELRKVNADTDPLRWFERNGGVVGPRKHADKPAPPQNAPDRMHPNTELLVLRTLVEDIRAKDPNMAVPDEARLEEAAHAGFRSEEGREVLSELEDASDRAGLVFPDPLRAETMEQAQPPPL